MSSRRKEAAVLVLRMDTHFRSSAPRTIVLEEQQVQLLVDELQRLWKIEDYWKEKP